MTNSPFTPGIASARLDPEALDQNFADLHPPLDPHEALVAADRCYFCHDAPCINGNVPTSIDIPAFFFHRGRIATGTPRGGGENHLRSEHYPRRHVARASAPPKRSAKRPFRVAGRDGGGQARWRSGRLQALSPPTPWMEAGVHSPTKGTPPRPHGQEPVAVVSRPRAAQRGLFFTFTLVPALSEDKRDIPAMAWPLTVKTNSFEGACKKRRAPTEILAKIRLFTIDRGRFPAEDRGRLASEDRRHHDRDRAGRWAPTLTLAGPARQFRRGSSSAWPCPGVNAASREWRDPRGASENRGGVHARTCCGGRSWARFPLGPQTSLVIGGGMTAIDAAVCSRSLSGRGKRHDPLTDAARRMR